MRRTENLKEVYAEKIYTRAINAVFNLNNYEPFSLPFYACLHAMVQNKRRILDTKNLRLRMIGNKIDMHAKIGGMGKDGEYRSYHVSGRRERIINGHGFSVGSDPIEFEEWARCPGEAYKTPIEIEVVDFCTQLDAFFKSIRKEEYCPLPNEFDANTGKWKLPSNTEYRRSASRYQV